MQAVTMPSSSTTPCPTTRGACCVLRGAERGRACPAAWAEIPDAETHLPGAAFLVAVVPDEDPDLEPTVRIHSPDEHVIPYEVMCWFLERVADQVEGCRAGFTQGDPEAVE